ncbi:MAG TPA: farnesyl diphosphate synthase [Candidatus Dormibacteraeota bacterium]|nr:farnesyl diphosphate synthase [Candidatus Dormibacteraeota bacterium]
MSVPQFFESDRAGIEEALDRLLPKEEAHPASIHKAMRYSVFAGGKRIRPILCLEAAAMFSENPVAAVSTGCALEFIHTYSLIHDDLPALDNDDFRRGKPTCHKVFGEAIAILAGDALLTLAFQTLAFVPVEPQRRLNILATIAQAAGTDRGMIGGQVADLEAEKKTPDVGTLEYIHRSKTAALIRASIVAGGIAGGATNEDVERLKCFGENIGWAFQVVDDILDVEESSAVLGKTAGKDQAQQKATYPALYGILQSRDIAADLAAKALSELDYYGERASRLHELAQFLVARRS